MESNVFFFWHALGASLFSKRDAFRMAWFFGEKKTEKGMVGYSPMLILDKLEVMK